MSFQVPKVKLSDGNEIATVGLGTWKSQPGQVYEAVKNAIDAGYRHIDCALAYQNEGEVGNAIKDKISEGKVKREDIFVTSKCWNTYHKKERVIECCRKSLSNLGLKYLDLYLVHWPIGYQEGDVVFPKNENNEVLTSDIDYVETWKGMEECVRNGLVRSIGLSNFNSEQISRILGISTIKPVMLQVESHPYLNQNKLIEFCRNLNIQVTAYSPLGSPDRPWANKEEPTLLEDPKIKELAVKYNKSTAQILLKFQVQRGVIIIPKSVTKERIISNIQLFDFELTPQEMETLSNFGKEYRYLHLSWLKHHPHYPFHIPF